MSIFKPQPPPPSEFEDQRDNPLIEFSLLSIGVLLFTAALFALIHFGLGYALTLLPLKTEMAWVDRLVDQTKLLDKAGQKAAHREKPLALLVDELAAPFLPEDLKLQFTLLDESTFNAFATLGGRIVLFDGARKALPVEQELAFVLCHEIGHIVLRHPARALGTQLTFQLAFAALGLTDLGGAELMSGLTSLSFSRAQETKADEFAMDCVHQKYGNVRGFKRFAEALERARAEQGFASPSFLSTHPLPADRLKSLRFYAQKKGYLD